MAWEDAMVLRQHVAIPGSLLLAYAVTFEIPWLSFAALCVGGLVYAGLIAWREL